MELLLARPVHGTGVRPYLVDRDLELFVERQVIRECFVSGLLVCLPLELPLGGGERSFIVAFYMLCESDRPDDVMKSIFLAGDYPLTKTSSSNLAGAIASSSPSGLSQFLGRAKIQRSSC
jgi:hypothetical protein